MASDRPQPSAFAQPCQIRWAKVPGWQWWPAVVVPETEEQRQQQLKVQQEQGNGNRALRNLVCFLVDNTMARCPQLPFDAHYHRFLNVAYSDKRLMQAVEEGRALLMDSSLWQPVSPRQLALQQAAGKVAEGGDKDAGSSQQPQQQPQPVLLPYPAPLPDDAAKRSSKQLLKWLQAAALAPEGPYNGIKDQQTRRVLHAVRSSRHVDCQLPEVGTEAATAAAEAEAPAPGPPARLQPVGPLAAPCRPPAASPAVEAAAAEDLRPSKRQRKPTGLLLQSSTRLPSLLNGTTPAGGGSGAAAGLTGADRSAAGIKRGLWGPAGTRPGAAGGGQRPGPHQQQQQQQQGLRPPMAQRSSSSNQMAVGGCKRGAPEPPKPFPGRASRFQLLRRSSGGGGSGSGGGGLSSAASRSSSSSGEHGGRRQGTCSPPPKRGCHQASPHTARVRAVTPELLCTPEPDSSSDSEGEEEEEQQQQQRVQAWEQQEEGAAAASGQHEEPEVKEEEQQQQQRPKEEPQQIEETSEEGEEEEEEDDDDDEILLLPRSGLLRPSTSRATANGATAPAAVAPPPADKQAAAVAVAEPVAAAADGGANPPAPAAPPAAAAGGADGAVRSSSPPTPVVAGGKSPGGWYHPITRLRRLSTPEEPEEVDNQAWSSSDYEQEAEDDEDEETETDEPEPEPPLALTRGRRTLAGKKQKAGTKRTRQQMLHQQLRGPPLPRTAASAAGAGGGHARMRQQARRATPRVTPTLTSATITSASTSHTATATPTSQGGCALGPAGGSSSICQPPGPLRPPVAFYPSAAMAAYLASCRGVSAAACASPSDPECVRSDTVGGRIEDEARRLLLPIDCGRRPSLFDPPARLPLASTSSPRFVVPERCRAVKTKRSVQQQQQQQQQRPQQQPHQGQAQQQGGHRHPSNGVPQLPGFHSLLHPHRHPHHPHGLPQTLMLPGSSPPLGPWASDVMVPAWDLLHGPPGPPWGPAAAGAAGGAGVHAAAPVGSPGTRTAAAGAGSAAAAADALDEGATLGRSGSTMGGLDCMGLVEDAPLCSMDDLFQLADPGPMTPEDLEAALSGQAAAASSREGSLAPDSGAGAPGRQPLVGGAWEGGGHLGGRGQHPKQEAARGPASAHRRSSSGSGSEHDTLDMPWEWEVHKDTPANPELQADLDAAAASEAAAAQRSLLRLKRLPSAGGGASDPDLSTPHFPPRHPRLRPGCDPTHQAPGRVVVVEAAGGVASGGPGSASSSSAATVLREALVGLVPGGDALQYLAEQLLSCREELAACRAARTEAEQSHHTAATQLSAAQSSLKAAQAGQEETQKLLAAKEFALAEAQQRVTQLEKDLQQLQAKLYQQAPPAPAAAAAVNGATPAQLQQQQWAQGQLRAREVELAAARMECERLRHVVAQGQQSGAVMAGHILSGVLASPGLTPAEKDKLRAEMQGMLVQVCMAPQQVAPRAPPAPTAEVK